MNEYSVKEKIENFLKISNESRKMINSRTLVIIFCLFLGYTNQGRAQYYSFGRNKIQYKDFDWHILKTEHFDIYYYPEMQELAEKGAFFAEESFKFLENKFNHSINRRIPLIFYSSHLHFQQTNVTSGFLPEGVGGFFEFIKGRVVIPSNGSITDFKRVIKHELVHVFTHSKISRIVKNHRRINAGFLPLWFTEGLADYWASDWDTQAEMVMRDGVFSGYVTPLQQIYRIQGTYLMYKHGQYIIKYIAKVYGEEKIILLLENFWKAEKFEDVMKITIGKSYKELDSEWIYHLKKDVYPLLENGDIPSKVTPVLAEKGFNEKPAFYRDSDDMPQMTFVSNRIGYTNIYKIRTDSYGERIAPEIVIEGERNSEFEAFHVLHSSIDVNDLRQLAFVTKSGESDNMYVYDLTEEKVISRHHFPDLVAMSSPAWSSDNERLVFSGLNLAGSSDLYILEVISGKLTKVTNDFYI